MTIELKNQNYVSSTGINLSLNCDNTQYMYNSLYLLNINNDENNFSSSAKVYLYSSKIYDGNNVIRDYIPVIDSSNRPCLFDKVGKICYYSATGTDFLYG